MKQLALWRVAALYLLPCLTLVWAHQNASHTWFFMDDFAWLGLPAEVHSAGDLLPTLFEPRAQGTVRVLSERVFFLVFGSLFGFSAAPFHYWVFLTQCVSLVLANVIAKKLSGGSEWIGFAVAMVWALSPDLSIPLAWLSSYNQILCACLALTAFYFLLRHIESGKSRDWILQFAAYLLGFFALEVIVVYPAIACTYVFFAARPLWRKALWLWAPALAFTAFHFTMVPKTPSPVYKMYFDSSIVTYLARYSFKAIGPSDLARFYGGVRGMMGVPVTWAVILALVTFLVFSARRKQFAPFFGIVWFVAFLAPLLPLKNHFSEYYIAIPSFGFALITGWGLVWALRSNYAVKAAGVALAGLLIWCNVSQARAAEGWYRRLSGEMHRLFEGMQAEVRRTAADTVLIAGVQDEVYISGFMDNPFRLIGIRNVHLVPGWESVIHSVPQDRIPFKLDQETAASLLTNPKTMVLSFDGEKVTDVTSTYRAVQSSQQRVTVLQLSSPVAPARLGPGWNDAENGFRWMPKQASVRLDSPKAEGAHLLVSVYGQPMAIDAAPGGKLEMTARVNGHFLGPQIISAGLVTLDFGRIETSWLTPGQTANEIVLEVSHTISPPGDGRELGVPVIEVALRVP